MGIYDALKLLAVKSPDTMREAIGSLRLPEDSPNLRMRYLILLDRAFSDPQAAPFTPAERAALIALAEPVNSGARDYTLRVRLTEVEQGTLQQLADTAGVSLSEYVRSRIF